MNSSVHSLLLGSSFGPNLHLPLPAALAQGTALTSQGRLQSGPAPAQGRFTMRDGLFTATLEFGSGVFNGGARRLELAARTGGLGAEFVPLSPRQAVRSTPYASHAAKTSQLRISWAPSFLQDTATLTPLNLSSTPSGTANSVTVPSGPNAKFYCLHQP